MKKTLILATLFTLATQISSPKSFAKVSVESTKATLQEKFLTPLEKKEKENARFSRAPMPAAKHRTRILDQEEQIDAKGDGFIGFAIDKQYGRNSKKEDESSWTKDAIVGCIYPKTGEIFVKRSDVYYPSSVLLGRRVAEASNEVCSPK